MNITDLPEIPADVHAGEPVRADDMNRILEWMRAAQSALAARTPDAAGTPAGGNPWESAPRRHPFEVGVEYDAAGAPARIVVARGNVWLGMIMISLLGNTEVWDKLRAATPKRFEVEETALNFAPGKLFLVAKFGGYDSPAGMKLSVVAAADVPAFSEKSPGWAVELADVKAPDAGGDVVVRQFLRGDLFAAFPWITC
ncbi:MAG: hypothetical protein ACI4P3_01155 [Candidatus Spyradosoma sp.]